MPTQKKERPPKAERILQLRKRLRMDQIAFAERLGVDQGTVSKWESGKVTPGPHTYIQIAGLADGDMKRQLLQDGGVEEAQQGVTNPRYASSDTGWDRELMAFVIETVAAELEKRGRKLNPAKFAELVMIFYDFCYKTGERESPMLERLMKIA